MRFLAPLHPRKALKVPVLSCELVNHFKRNSHPEPVHIGKRFCIVIYDVAFLHIHKSLIVRLRFAVVRNIEQ